MGGRPEQGAEGRARPPTPATGDGYKSLLAEWAGARSAFLVMFRRIVCPTDFSAPAAQAAHYAAGLAKSCGAEVILLHVVAELSYPMRSLGTVTAFPNLQDEMQKRASEELDEAKAKLGEGITVRTEMRHGDIHDEVLGCATDNDCDLIVLGTHGHTGLKHMLLGSTAERIVRMSEIPVLTVRAKED